MLGLLMVIFSLGAASLAFGSLVGGSIRYGAAWDGLEQEWRGASFTSTVHVAIREPLLAPAAKVSPLPRFRPVATVRLEDGLRAAA